MAASTGESDSMANVGLYDPGHDGQSPKRTDSVSNIAAIVLLIASSGSVWVNSARSMGCEPRGYWLPGILRVLLVRNNSRRGYFAVRPLQDSGMMSTCCSWRERSSA